MGQHQFENIFLRRPGDERFVRLFDPTGFSDSGQHSRDAEGVVPTQRREWLARRFPFGGGAIGNVGQIVVGLVYQAVDFNHQPIILQTVLGADGQPTIALSLNG
ncbi:hypothetical protein PGTUg99_003761 [Puccinia graminis f. sp. tritici]|uniref:Uncharacterized protein n=1 Tax=Puccinia graminis f. sp. tritici TaxID=56615 RepID=A0A5B0R4S1_PUCGR|nr:hypothetical protein PGTUg99_003761 [Puccinia graminis f. sp. tritici]